MKTKHLIQITVALTILAALAPAGPNRSGASLFVPACSAAEEEPVDFKRAQKLFDRRKAGETLTEDEQAYLQRAMKARAQAGKQKQGGGNTNTTPVSDPKIVATLVPLDELTGTYKGEDGGLYGGGRNMPPPAHQAAYLKEAEMIRPLDEDGKPSEDGKIVLLSLGMSNTTMEYSEFVKVANAETKKSSKVVVVDGSIGSRTTTVWALDGAAALPAGEKERLEKLFETTGRKGGMPNTWTTVEKRLKDNGVTAKQVQAVWLKQAEASPAKLGAFPEHARVFESLLVDMINIAKERYPNLRVIYLSSRIYGGYATTYLNPEPYAYEEAFSVRWLIQKQISGEPRLNYDAARGAVKSPILVWGPYLWANGATPRKSDGLVWTPQDLENPMHDHTHPGDTAKQKVAQMLLKFFESDAGARRWFVNTATSSAK